MRIVIPLAVMAVIAYLLTLMPWGLSFLGAFALEVVVLAVLGAVGFSPLTMVGIPMLPRNLSKVLLISALIFGFAFGGWFSMIKGWIPSASIIPGSVGEPQASKCSVSSELFGKTATIDINAWDMESNTPYSSAVDVNPTYVYKNGVGASDYVTTLTDTSGSTVSAAVGDMLYFFGGGSTYYADPVEMCVDSQRPTVSIDAHTIVSESDMQITGYDDTGSSALTTGTTNEEDYEIALGADEDASFYLKLKVNAANKAYRFAGWAVRKNGDVDECKPVESGYVKDVLADFLDNTDISYNETAGSVKNITGGYDAFYRWESGPLMMHEWDSFKHEFIISSDSDGTDAADGASSSASSDLCIALALDATRARGVDGVIYDDYHDHGSTENNVGLSETLTSPLGKQVGVVIEGT